MLKPISIYPEKTGLANTEKGNYYGSLRPRFLNKTSASARYQVIKLDAADGWNADICVNATVSTGWIGC